MKIGIVGGGITGLVAAEELVENGHKVFLFESDKQLGGLAKSYKRRNWQWPLEVFFHHLFTSDKEVASLLKKLGLESKVFYKDVKTSLYNLGKIYPFDNLEDFLKFPQLKLIDKFRMGMTLFVLRQLPTALTPLFEKHCAVDLFPKLMGKNGWNLVWKPLLMGKFGIFAEEVSSSWFWMRIKSRSKRLGYLRGGFNLLIERLREKIEVGGGEIFIRTPITEISKLGNKWQLSTSSKKFLVDKILLACPLSSALELVSNFFEGENFDYWNGLKTMGAMTMVLRLKRKFLPGDTYWLNILEKEFPFIVITEHTNFIDKKNYGKEHLVYIGGYYRQNDRIFRLRKKQIFDRFSPFLRRINPSFDQFLLGYDFFTSHFAQPVIPVNYSQFIPPIELIPNAVYLATSNHIYPWDRGVNFAVKIAKQFVDLV